MQGLTPVVHMYMQATACQAPSGFHQTAMLLIRPSTSFLIAVRNW